ncbi:hypothetical protein DY000_02023242 [Brassica cretica]|uniref:Uncharacterized protein n=1 Tax=Brassica cretica TaxID=69181 RepID=A0ABQ7EN40_BRACR|nr:hypothetical protein DY000_02023242 [Brassica cretica]
MKSSIEYRAGEEGPIESVDVIGERYDRLSSLLRGRGTVGFSQVWLRDVEASTAPSSPADDPGMWKL